MAIHLAPGEIVAQIADAGIADGAGVKGREAVGLKGCVGEVGCPQVDVERSEAGENGGK